MTMFLFMTLDRYDPVMRFLLPKFSVVGACEFLDKEQDDAALVISVGLAALCGDCICYATACRSIGDVHKLVVMEVVQDIIDLSIGVATVEVGTKPDLLPAVGALPPIVAAWCKVPIIIRRMGAPCLPVLSRLFGYHADGHLYCCLLFVTVNYFCRSELM